jgi:GntR family transcriptional regulator, sialic acid-inducible nan operon repressor
MNDLKIEKIKRQRLYTAVAEQIQKLIIVDDLSPGDSLPSERELMMRLGVGRSSVREALMWLRTVGIIEFVSGEKARVAAPSFEPILEGMKGLARHYVSRPGGVAQLQEARVLFETGIVREAARRATPEQVARLRATLNANLKATDINIFETSDVAFHYQIAAIPGNPIYTAAYDTVTGWLIEQRRISLKIPDALNAARNAHTMIFEAIAAGDPNAAAEAMENHLLEVQKFYHDALPVVTRAAVGGRRSRMASRT